MIQPFLQTKFDGARFDQHTLPIEVARDLAAYESLVIDLARYLYLRDNPGRQRVPRGFDAEFHLHLQRVDAGSARPLLSIVTAGTLALNTGINPLFEKARDLIGQCVSAPDGQFPEDFPRDLLSHFNQVGRSLREGESWNLSPESAAPAILTPEKRKHLVLAADKVYEREIELSGSIGEADWEKSTFRLRVADGTQATVPMPESFHAKAREFGGRPRHQVTVKGVAAYDSWEKLQKIVSVDSLDIQKDFQLAARFDALSDLQDGWLDGVGKAPDSAALALVAENIVGHFPENLPIPAIVPTPEGNLLMEWSLPGSPSLDVALPALTAVFHAFLPDESDLDHEFALSDDRAWPALFQFLNSQLENIPT